MIRVAACLIVAASAVPALGADWIYFDAPVQVNELWRDHFEEGNISSGVVITDALGSYSIGCRSRSEMGDQLPGWFIYLEDGGYHEATRSPAEYLADERGSPYVMLQWAEACRTIGLLP